MIWVEDDFLVFTSETQSHGDFKGLFFAWQSALNVFPERSVFLLGAVTTSAINPSFFNYEFGHWILF